MAAAKCPFCLIVAIFMLSPRANRPAPTPDCSLPRRAGGLGEHWKRTVNARDYASVSPVSQPGQKIA
jgi:hypothetical protein